MSICKFAPGHVSPLIDGTINFQMIANNVVAHMVVELYKSSRL